MKTVVLITVIALTLLIAGAEAGDTSCFARGGKCVPKSSCTGQRLSGRVCNGMFCCPGNDYCCVPKDTSCQARGGSCMARSACGASYLSGKICNGQYCCKGSNYCCVGPTLRGKPAPRFTKDMANCIGIPSSKQLTYADGIQKALNSFKLNDAEELAVFLANCAVESGYWTTMTEYGCYKNGANYQGGCRYKGRGIIQITHKDNYAALGKYFGQDFVSNPEAVATTEWGFKSAAWFWMHYAKIDSKCYSPRGKFYQNDVQCRRKCAAAIINGYYRSTYDSCGIRDPHGWVPRKTQYHIVSACVAKAIYGPNHRSSLPPMNPNSVISPRVEKGKERESKPGRDHEWYRAPRQERQGSQCITTMSEHGYCLLSNSCKHLNQDVKVLCVNHDHGNKTAELVFEVKGGPQDWSIACSKCALADGYKYSPLPKSELTDLELETAKKMAQGQFPQAVPKGVSVEHEAHEQAQQHPYLAKEMKEQKQMEALSRPQKSTEIKERDHAVNNPAFKKALKSAEVRHDDKKAPFPMSEKENEREEEIDAQQPGVIVPPSLHNHIPRVEKVHFPKIKRKTPPLDFTAKNTPDVPKDIKPKFPGLDTSHVSNDEDNVHLPKPIDLTHGKTDPRVSSKMRPPPTPKTKKTVPSPAPAPAKKKHQPTSADKVIKGE